jgi:hypothetical protein
MKRAGLCLTCVFLLLGVAPAAASTLGTMARNVIPAEVQQIISVDYRSLRNSPTALALRDRVLPENLKELEGALRGLGIDADTEVEQLTFVSYREKEGGLKVVGIATGPFQPRRVAQRMRVQKVKPDAYRDTDIYPAPGGFRVAFADDFTLVFGDSAAVKTALDARDGELQNMNYNSQITEMVASVGDGAVWSVLDAQGTQHMMRSALGEAARLADYETFKERLVASRYVMDFRSGVNFDLEVYTSDSMTAAALSSLVRAGMMYRRMSAEGAEKVALEAVSVDSDRRTLKVNFKTDDSRFQSLLDSELFTAISQ